MDRNKEALLAIGFVDIGKWERTGEILTYHLEVDDISSIAAMLDTPDALYAFTREDRVVYIGKTTRSIRKRFTGYCRPGISQRTNIRCNAYIKEHLDLGSNIRILVFTPINQLQYSGFEINLAAGLEDTLIREFEPSWNGRQSNRPISEDTEREVEIEAATPEPIPQEDYSNRSKTIADFHFTLFPTYYEKGLINVGVDASVHIGKDGDPILIEFSNDEPPVNSKINRTATSTGAVRVVGNNSQIAKWFQANFRKGETVQALIIDPHRIRLLAD